MEWRVSGRAGTPVSLRRDSKKKLRGPSIVLDTTAYICGQFWRILTATWQNSCDLKELNMKFGRKITRGFLIISFVFVFVFCFFLLVFPFSMHSNLRSWVKYCCQWTIFEIYEIHIWLRGVGEKTREMYFSLLSLKMISFVLFPQASLPSLNFNISELVSLSLEIFKSLRWLAGKNESFRNLLTGSIFQSGTGP